MHDGVANRIDQRWKHIIAQLRHQAATGTTAAIITSNAKETSMSWVDELKAGADSVVQTIERIDKDALAMYETVMAHPEAGALVKELATLVGIDPIVGTIAGLAAPITSTIALFKQNQKAAA